MQPLSTPLLDAVGASRSLVERARKAIDRAVTYLMAQGLLERRSLDGHLLGIQAALATDPQGSNAIDLASLADALVANPVAHEHPQQDDEQTWFWVTIVREIEARLGFGLEPELFSNMLYCAHLGTAPQPELAELGRGLLETFRRSDARGLYHFFTSMRFACDIDCTAIAARARLVMGDIDLGSERGRHDLHRITSRILGSAAVDDIDPQHNASHNKSNGELRKYVFKVYLDDHRVQGSEYGRNR